MNTSGKQDDNSNTESERDRAGPERSIQLSNNRIDSRQLFVGIREIIIAHGAEIYRLRLTAQNKLILTK